MREVAVPGRVAGFSTCIAVFVLAVVTGCGGGDGTSPPPPPPPPPAASALRQAAEGEVVAYFKARIQQRLAQGLDGTVQPPSAGIVFSPGPSVSDTVLQEAGVDEDDRMKSDGATLYTLHPSRFESGTTFPQVLGTSRIQPDGSLQDLGGTNIATDQLAQGMFLATDARKLALVSQKAVYGSTAPGGPSTLLPTPAIDRRVVLDLYTADGTRPAPLRKVEVDGWLVGSRRIGNVLYLVTSWTPDLGIQLPARSSPEQVSTTLGTIQAATLLPKVRVDGGAPQPLVAETDCYLQTANASLGLQLTTITAFDLASTTVQRASRCFVGDGNALYMSPQNVYIASSQQVWIAGAVGTTVFPSGMTTDIHKFSLAGLAIAYRGSGQVPGHLGWDPEKMPRRMSEHQGDLRVVSYTGETGWFGTPVASTPPTAKPSPATLTVLRENAAAGRLTTVATLPNAQRPAPLGKEGEQVYAVHFAGPRAYVVTFRRIDPLYVLDLSDAADPKAVGELAMPGFSDYLFPLAGGKLLGVGKDADARGVVGGLKVALFDVADAARPRLLASSTLGGNGTSAALDSTRHGINILEQGDKARIALPVTVVENSRLAWQGLARYTVDTAAGTLVERPAVLATRFTGTSDDWVLFSKFNVSTERSVQTTNATYYMTGGQVIHTPEP
jgi:hypothetical protein